MGQWIVELQILDVQVGGLWLAIISTRRPRGYDILLKEHVVLPPHPSRNSEAGGIVKRREVQGAAYKSTSAWNAFVPSTLSSRWDSTSYETILNK